MSEPNKPGTPEIDIEEIMKEIRAQIIAEGAEPDPAVEEIVREIRERIKTEKTAEPDLAFEDIPKQLLFDINAGFDAYVSALEGVNTGWRVPYYVIVGRGGIIGFIKRIVRKVDSILLKPMNHMQNDLNAHFATCHNYSYKTLRALKDEVDRLSAQVEKLTAENEELKKRL